jgi:hypothetical protein
MTSMSKSDLDGALRVAADCLHDASHRESITHNFDLRHAGVIEEAATVIEEVLPRESQL